MHEIILSSITSSAYRVYMFKLTGYLEDKGEDMIILKRIVNYVQYIL